MGPAGMSFTAADLRIDDSAALFVRLFDVAVAESEWHEEADGAGDYNEDTDAEDDDLIEDPLDEVARALSDDDRPVDDRSLDEVQWSVLVDNWWRAAPPFVATRH